MATRSNRARTLGEHPIFGDEQAAALQSDVDELRSLLSVLGDQVNSQFTSIAARAPRSRGNRPSSLEARHAPTSTALATP